MFKHSIVLLAVVALCGLAYADVEAPGDCPTDIKVMPNYDPTKYTGLWYEYARYPYFFEDNGKCNTATYTLMSDGHVLVNNSMINMLTDQTQGVIGNAVMAENAKLKIAIEVYPGFTAEANYWVLDTDYTSYSCVYACEPIPILINSKAKMHTTYLWILTREQKPTKEEVQKCYDVFVSNNISLKELMITDQESC